MPALANSIISSPKPMPSSRPAAARPYEALRHTRLLVIHTNADREFVLSTLILSGLALDGMPATGSP